ncbi:MAG: NapC/NirT family cytochrome c, partial [Actinomycetota bacterium]|nr:NapC/NirT family cytochrome c [Actinomycetota bacterium]
ALVLKFSKMRKWGFKKAQPTKKIVLKKRSSRFKLPTLGAWSQNLKLSKLKEWFSKPEAEPESRTSQAKPPEEHAHEPEAPKLDTKKAPDSAPDSPSKRVKISFKRDKIKGLRKKTLRDKLPRIKIPPKLVVPLIVGLVVLPALVAAGYASWYTSQPKFCEKCHEMQPAIDSWKKVSLHAEVSCGACHYVGWFSFVKQKIALASDTYKHFTGRFDQPINADSSLSRAVDNDGCLKCHTPKRVITPRRTLIMDHNVHLKKGINCTTCHNRAGHPGLAEYKTFISMEGCFRCHGLSKTAIAPGRCNACHPKDFDLVPQSHKTPTWQRPDHGKTAKKNISYCTMCHQTTFCRGCHGVEVPHPDKFIKKEHGDIGSKNPQICQKCHDQRDACNACHHKGYNPSLGGWVPTHKYIVANVGPAYCFSCHGPTFCAYCHVRGQLLPKERR